MKTTLILLVIFQLCQLWGIRRNIGNHFTYETGIGIGYLHYFKKDNVILISEPDVAVNLHLRIGYQF